MKEQAGEYAMHIFICTKSSGCGELGADELRKELKDWIKDHREWRKRVRINTAGCMDLCKRGIAVAIQPQNRWLLDVKLKNLDEVKAQLERLLREGGDQHRPREILLR